MEILEQIRSHKIVPVVVLNDKDKAIDTMQALIDGGLPVAEVCFRTPAARESIELMTKKFPDALIGAGTVINEKQCREAIVAGAKFIVSPGLSEKVYQVCKEHDIPYLPGVLTPTEIMQALDLGITTVKFFPASNFGGLKTIKALCSAFPSIHIMPTGGVNKDNILEFLSFDKIIACGGSWMMKGTLEEIKANTAEAVRLVKGE